MGWREAYAAKGRLMILVLELEDNGGAHLPLKGFRSVWACFAALWKKQSLSASGHTWLNIRPCMPSRQEKIYLLRQFPGDTGAARA